MRTDGGTKVSDDIFVSVVLHEGVLRMNRKGDVGGMGFYHGGHRRGYMPW